MSPRLKRLSLLLAGISLLILLSIPTLILASPGAASLSPSVIPPEPYPGTNIYPARIYLHTSADLQILYRQSIDIDGLQPADGMMGSLGTFVPSDATVFINPAQSSALLNAGLNPVPIPNEGYRSFLAYGPGSVPPGWPTFDAFVTRMQSLETAYPAIVRLEVIGYSVQNRGIYCLEITDNPGVDENEPEFKYTANHHGDETTGIEMTMRLAELLASSYSADPTITKLVDNMEIWICPIYNPDGYVSGSRYNAHGQDLNRDFPDRFTDPIDDPSGREPETQAFMNFGYAHRFVMGANYHGGAQVLNYPWDAVAGPPYYAPDDLLFIDFGIGYTSRNPNLWGGGFPRGITRGWQWYMINGGMQDWAYYYHGEHHVTLEISFTKYPPFDEMDYYWENNRDAMLWWMQQALTGFAGEVLDARDSTALDASLTLVGRDAPNIIFTDLPVGDFHRVISSGSYTLQANSDGYLSQTSNIVVYSDTLITHDFYLCPTDTIQVSGTITDAVTGSPLQATIEFIGSPQVTTSDPTTGQYSIAICPASYTMQVTAQWHYPLMREVNIDHSQVQDFTLNPTPNLSPSSKSASSSSAFPGDVITYTLNVINIGEITPVLVTDTLPADITWTGDLSATYGAPSFDSGRILWQGQISPSQPLTITYSVSLNQCLPAGIALLNIAEYNDGVNGIITGTVELHVDNASPTSPSSPLPFDGAYNLPITTTLAWAPSSDLNCDDLTYDIALSTSPKPDVIASGLTSPYYSPGILLPGVTYYWQVIVHDNLTTTLGPIWMFSTLGLQHRIYLPVLIK